jgi:hypothetical protein
MAVLLRIKRLVRDALRHRGVSFGGVPIYTKGVVRREGRQDVLYILISSKRSVL